MDLLQYKCHLLPEPVEGLHWPFVSGNGTWGLFHEWSYIQPLRTLYLHDVYKVSRIHPPCYYCICASQPWLRELRLHWVHGYIDLSCFLINVCLIHSMLGRIWSESIEYYPPPPTVGYHNLPKNNLIPVRDHIKGHVFNIRRKIQVEAEGRWNIPKETLLLGHLQSLERSSTWQEVSTIWSFQDSRKNPQSFTHAFWTLKKLSWMYIMWKWCCLSMSLVHSSNIHIWSLYNVPGTCLRPEDSTKQTNFCPQEAYNLKNSAGLVPVKIS